MSSETLDNPRFRKRACKIPNEVESILKDLELFGNTDKEQIKELAKEITKQKKERSQL